ncbi:MAG: MATE family efflux transporter [Treponema sp. CETP13]|nr:MAG: MATE family efflux transporter [Treponema sp. CETP13]
MKEKEIKFTEGSIFRPLIRFTTPIFFSLLLQCLYGAVDLVVVGQFAQSDSISAVATGSQIAHVLLMIISGLSMGTTILLGQKIGAKKFDEAGSVVGTTIALYCIVIALVTIFMSGFATQIAKLVNAPERAFIPTVDYIRITGLGAVFLIGYNVFGAIFRGIGDSKTPLFAVIIATILNIAGDLFLVGVCGMGAKGAAIATVFAQALSVVISVVIAKKHGFPFDFTRKDIYLNKNMTALIVKLGAPIAIQNGLIQISFLAITAIINVFGVTISAGVGITERMISFLMLSQISFGESLAAFVAHNVGAQKYNRATKSLIITIIVSVSISIIIAFIAFFHGKWLLQIFTTDKNVLAASYEYLQVYSFDIVSTALLFCFIGYFNGFGKTRFNMWHGIIGSLFVRIPLSYVFAQKVPFSLFLIGAAIPISSGVQDILCIIYFIYLQRKTVNKKQYL